MSKLALINRNEKRKKLVAKFSKKRDALQAIVDDPKASKRRAYAARLKIQALPRNSNKTRAAQPLRADRPSARRVPQVRPRPQQAPRVRDARRDPRHRQGQLVAEQEH